MLQTPVTVLLFLTGLAVGGYVTRQGTNLIHNGQKIFLSGANTAWVAYGYDFGNNQYQYRRDRYIYLMDKVKEAGGNSMRTWVHIEGATSPVFDSNGCVTGLDKGDGSFVKDFIQYLDDAKERNILIFPCLWNGALKQNHNNLQGLITDSHKLQCYIDKALIPWVKAVKDHPALGGWDIINEMEGEIKPGVHDSEPCFDTTFLVNSGAGWAGATYTAEQFLKFINWQVDAIRRTDPTALVTAGSWSQRSQTDKWNDKNLYSDECLVKAGGKTQGTLTFYSTHSYDWQGHFSADAPFKHNFSEYGLDKPLVVAEFNSMHGEGMTIEQMFQYLYTHGYAGAWSWHAQADGGDTDPTDTQMRGIAALRGKHEAGGVVPLDLSGSG
ncbi:mannan endo-1,4-beta-mannosidase-like [Pomacea canaliculata]|uniref:mannan endo-1,4-beta-mannosidase-like n=1 Tax=Pomacea canaliculata TaxID=400727 RepID=UPI000D73B783|nr:mannan endo-1,4-beta-mannosidase-like [Pomacea canaliculata]XP_025105017.1 mannan endo-1,4-beta-mannosidase-like [Pomacea canaliculata]